MRKLLIILTGTALVLMIGCGGSKRGQEGEQGQPAQSKQASSDKAPQTKEGMAGERRGSGRQEGGEIDVDKLDIPQQMRDAIKSGQIPPDKVREMLAQFQGGDARPVNVQTVGRNNLNSYLVLNGIVEPERMVEIYSRLSAYVKQIVREEGDIVKENDVIALLDDKEIRISYEQAKITLEQALLTRDEVQRDFTRSQELIKKELISEQEFQTSEAAFKKSQLEYENRLKDFSNLELQLSWTRIRALSEGYITERLIEVGDRVNANEQVYTIEDFKPLLIRVFVPTTDSTRLNVGMLSEVTTEVLKGNVFNGSVKLINPRIDTQTGTVKVTIEVYDESLKLKPGMFVEARIIIGMKENVLAVPRKAILYKQNKTYVFVKQGNSVSQREITIGLTEEDLVEITSGLTESEVIVTVGVESLKDGDRIEVLQ
ncbi:MAG: efflux RND transporter periplasmic adaptor subunit [Acidobacteria bacterium]|nr:efflux RND transporter periplasmic adaptor subunit [Acidobacteriota bacterium]